MRKTKKLQPEQESKIPTPTIGLLLEHDQRMKFFAAGYRGAVLSYDANRPGCEPIYLTGDPIIVICTLRRLGVSDEQIEECVGNAYEAGLWSGEFELERRLQLVQ